MIAAVIILSLLWIFTFAAAYAKGRVDGEEQAKIDLRIQRLYGVHR